MLLNARTIPRLLVLGAIVCGCLLGFNARASVAPGILIVAADEWHVSDAAYDISPPSSDRLVKNIGSLFAPNGTGRFLIYTDHWCYGPDFVATLQAQGHTVEQSLTPASLSGYDGVFVGGNLEVDRAALSAYFLAGGNIYLAGGTAVPDEDVFWNQLLNPVGLSISPAEYPGDVIVASFTSPELFEGVVGLFTENPTPIHVLSGSWPFTRTVSTEAGYNWWAAYNLPTAPATLTATSLSQTAIRLNWTDTTGFETGFRIERKLGTAAFAEVAVAAANAVTFTDAGLMAGKTYTYRVRAQLSRGTTRYSNSASATTAPAAPAAPSDLAALAVSSTRINLTWTDNSSSETGFQIERKSGAGSFAQIGTVNANVVAYGDLSLAAETTYTYRVHAVNAGGMSADSNEASATTLPTPPEPPAAPSALTVTVLSSASLKVDWQDNSGNETGFRVERRTGAASFAEVAALGTDVTSFTDNGLAPATSYTYRVRAVGVGGFSAYSNLGSGATLPLPVTAPSQLQITGCVYDLELTWQDNSNNETGFEVERKVGTGPFVRRTTLASGTTAYTDAALAANTSYTYRVRATAAGGSSGYSNEATATTPAAAPKGKLVAQPAKVQFPATRAGGVVQRSFVLTNKGTDPVAVCLRELSTGPFRTLGGAGSFVLAKGQRRSIQLQFGPTAVGSFSAELPVRSNDPKHPLINVKLTARSR